MEARSAPPVLQGMDKVSTACQLRFDLRRTSALSPEVKLRLARLAGSHMTEEGTLLIEAKRFRTQEQNRLDAIQRLSEFIQKALIEPKRRKAVVIRAGPGRACEKIHRSKIKLLRKSSDWEE